MSENLKPLYIDTETGRLKARESTQQDVVVTIDPDGRGGRLCGLFVDTIGGSYRLELENCTLLSEQQQQDMIDAGEIKEDDMFGIVIPSKVVPLSTATEIFGAVMMNHPDYVRAAVTQYFEELSLNHAVLAEGETVFVQAGSLVSFCVKPFDTTSPCILHFVKIADGGRCLNMKRFPAGETPFFPDGFRLPVVTGMSWEYGKSGEVTIHAAGRRLPEDDKKGKCTWTISFDGVPLVMVSSRGSICLKDGDEARALFDTAEEIKVQVDIIMDDRPDYTYHSAEYALDLSERVVPFNPEGSSDSKPAVEEP